MERLTHDVDFGLEDWEETLFFVKSDPGGAYNILDIARFQGEAEFDEILKNIALRLAAYEDTGFTPEEIQQMRWISVEERLPEQENTQVLMTDGECHYISSRNNMVRFLDCEGIFIPGKAGAGVKVTHWMPIPNAQEETNED